MLLSAGKEARGAKGLLIIGITNVYATLGCEFEPWRQERRERLDLQERFRQRRRKQEWIVEIATS
jgi:hypothetical protein